MPGDDLFEVVEQRVTRRGMGEVCDNSRARPGDNGSQKDANQDGAANSVHHEENREDTMGTQSRQSHGEQETYPPTNIPSHIVGLWRGPAAQ